MLWSKNKKIVIPVHTLYSYIKVGYTLYKGVFVARTCYLDGVSLKKEVFDYINKQNQHRLFSHFTFN